jgi:uncharacterized repeat protein (TIGR04138 family)
MHSNDLNEKINRIVKRDSRYKRDAYEFVSQAVNYTCARQHDKKHISSLELLTGIRDYAFDQYGPFSEDILKSWSVKTPQDIGRIVFALVLEQALAASEDDSPEDFNIDFDLFESSKRAFEEKEFKQPKVPTID